MTDARGIAEEAIGSVDAVTILSDGYQRAFADAVLTALSDAGVLVGAEQRDSIMVAITELERGRDGAPAAAAGEYQPHIDRLRALAGSGEGAW